MYLTFKAIHLIFMVTWFAGLFYMFRLFVYHVENQSKPEVVKVLNTMSRKLYYYITYPAMVLTIVFGSLLLIEVPGLLNAPWFHAKLTLLVLLIGYHHYIGYIYKKFRDRKYILNSKQCRLINEVPVLFLVAIVILAVFKPWS